jgi:hypothetical protein
MKMIVFCSVIDIDRRFRGAVSLSYHPTVRLSPLFSLVLRALCTISPVFSHLPLVQPATYHPDDEGSKHL